MVPGTNAWAKQWISQKKKKWIKEDEKKKKTLE